MIRILAVEDEPAIQRLLGAVLARGGYEVVAAATAREAQAALARGGIDAVILDLGLPDRDGLELIGWVRSTAALPILVLTARTDITEKASALDLGTDDYVTKPFDGDELLARLRSALRRSRPGSGADNVVEHGPVKIDRARHAAFVNGRQVMLTPREFSVL
jgi:two-component system KDP operon response regulator KdpE